MNLICRSRYPRSLSAGWKLCSHQLNVNSIHSVRFLEGINQLCSRFLPPYPQILDMMCIIIILSKYVLLIVYAVTPHWFLSLPICLVVVEWPPRIFVLFVLFAPDPNFRRTASFVLWRRFSSSALSKYTLDERDYVRAVHKLEIYSNTEPNTWNNRYRRLGSFEFSWQTYINLGPLWRHNTEK